MVTIKRILCPIDFSEFSRPAIACALEVARWQGATVTALHMVPPMESMLVGPVMTPYPPVVYTEADLQRFRAAAETFVAEQGLPGPIEVTVVVGAVVDGIVGRARTWPAELIVMGTHGRSGFDRLMLGSVSERVLRKAPCPVLTVPVRHDGVSAPPMPFRRVLCPIDFSPASLRSLDYAVAFANAAGADLRLLNVVEPVPVFEPVALGGPGLPQYEEQATSQARRRLRDIIDDRRASLGGAMSETLGLGKPYREILRVAAEYRCDLVVMGVHGGHSGIAAFGLTTNHVVRGAVCPVLSVHA